MASRVSFAAGAVYRAPCGTRLGPRAARGGSHDHATATTAQAHSVDENGEIADPANERSDALSTAVGDPGRFWIHLGAVARVHKTITVPGGAASPARTGGVVVFGYVETRGRVRSAQETGTFEFVPHKRVQYRGRASWRWTSRRFSLVVPRSRSPRSPPIRTFRTPGATKSVGRT